MDSQPGGEAAFFGEPFEVTTFGRGPRHVACLLLRRHEATAPGG